MRCEARLFARLIMKRVTKLDDATKEPSGACTLRVWCAAGVPRRVSARASSTARPRARRRRAAAPARAERCGCGRRARRHSPRPARPTHPALPHGRARMYAIAWQRCCGLVQLRARAHAARGRGGESFATAVDATRCCVYASTGRPGCLWRCCWARVASSSCGVCVHGVCARVVEVGAS